MPTTFQAPPVRTPFPDAKAWQNTGTPSWGWIKWFQEITDGFNGISTGGVLSVFGRTGAIIAQPGDYAVGQVKGAAPLASPALTGIPTAPTAAPATNTTQIATTAFVEAAVAGGGAVSSVFGRVGAVVAMSGDYSFSQISGLIAPSQFVNGSANQTAQTANISATTLLAVGASAGLYLITVYLIVSTAASISSTLPDSRIIFTDRDSSATITVPLTSGLTTNTTSTFAQASFYANAKASTNIQYDVGQVTAYASSGTAMQFAYRARAVYLG